MLGGISLGNQAQESSFEGPKNVELDMERTSGRHGDHITNETSITPKTVAKHTVRRIIFRLL